MLVTRLNDYLNPLARFGNRKYSSALPFFTTLCTVLILEFYDYTIAHNPHATDLLAIFLFITLIIYFSFRDAIKGGLIAAAITIAYYFYIITTRHYTGAQRSSGIETTIVLGILYVIMSAIIGGLRQTIDRLLERTLDEKRRLETIIQQLPVGVIITDNNGRITQDNKQVQAILGKKFPPEFMFGQDRLLNGKLKGKVVAPTDSPIAQVLVSGRSISGREYTVERPDGKVKYLQISASPIRGNQGKVIAAAQIINDVTTQKELEKRKDDFVNMASHELKTPITSMKLYLEVLCNMIKNTSQEKELKIVDSLQYQTERLQELVADLLDVSRIQTGKLTFKKELFDINELLFEIVDGLSGTTKDHIIHFEKKSPIKVYADKFRVYQVITNLITNAIKYSPPNSPIQVRVKRQKNKAEVSVQDFGIGIAKDQQHKIFDRLYQVNDDKEKTFPGFGMGLYIAKEIVQRHRGSIWVESEKGKGSTFYFTLPLHQS